MIVLYNVILYIFNLFKIKPVVIIFRKRNFTVLIFLPDTDDEYNFRTVCWRQCRFVVYNIYSSKYTYLIFVGFEYEFCVWPSLSANPFVIRRNEMNQDIYFEFMGA